ncbi:MAG: hypothetical protein QGG89_09060, partial [Vicinamibacterales bacterium]|nr:hypothetical protein [Vicinamibacterales bacterium]
PRLVRTRLGAATADLLADTTTITDDPGDPSDTGDPDENDTRVVSGSLLTGRLAAGNVAGFLGRYHRQVCLLREGRDRELLGWLAPGLGKF